MRLDPVAVAAAVLVLDDVPGVGQVGDDAVRAAFGDSQAGGDVPQPGSRVLGDAEQDSGVLGQETPVLRAHELTVIF
jgi:hypothetical protein